MKQKILTYSLILICTILFVACKKYPEGDYIKDGTSNIVGNWYLSLYEVNGIDSTNLINYNGSDDYKKISIGIFHRQDKDFIIGANGTSDTGWFINSDKDLKFQNKYPSAIICQSGYCFKTYFTPEAGTSATWNIIKLTKTELTLTCNLTNNYKLKFNK